MIQNTPANVLIDNKGDGLPFAAAIYETHIENLDLAASHIPAPPLLLTEPNSNKAIALDSVTYMRDSFPVVTTKNFSGDQRTRIVLFARGVILAPDETASVLTARAEGGEHRIYPLPVEHVGNVHTSAPPF